MLQPDLFIGHRDHLRPKSYDGPPILVVEVLSPTTWHRDLGRKMAAYAHADVPHYWVVAPDSGSQTVYGLGDRDMYVEEHHVESEQELALTKPLEVTLRPELLTLHP